MKARLKHYKQGWIVEYRKRVLLWHVWNPVTRYRGSKTPFYYSMPEAAINGALEDMKHSILI